MSRVTVLVEGGLLPDDLLEKIADGSAQGQRAADFGITSGRLSDEIMRAFSDAQSYWSAFQHRYERASKSGRESTTTVTRESFVIPLLEALGYKLEFKRSLAVGDQSFNISHIAGDDTTAPPVNIVSAEETLDERGSARRSAHSTVQEYLNLSDSVWGMASNGRRLRLLRNSSRLAKPRYIEFDLAGMMESNVYSDFHLLYRLLHRTRLPKSAADSSECWLEKYYNEGVEQGSRVRDRLRDGVVDALKIFGNTFLSHEKSGHLREQISAGHLTAAAFYRELLRLVYRLLFLMVGEERRLMFPESRENEDRRAVFTEHYGVNRLRARVESYVGEDSEIDLWESLKQSFNILRDDRAAHKLGMAALNGELFGPHGCPHLDGGGDRDRAAFCRNDQLLRAIDCLSKFDDEGIRRRVNFGALDVEELGSVYESLLEYHPQVSASPPSFDLVWGSERKSTGSYYTPPELVRELIRSALVPVLEEHLKPAKSTQEREKAILSMRVVDPAAGSGHFLLAAARQMGRELAKIRTGEEEPPPSAFRRAVRDVIRECIYAVDKNPLAVDLCKVALWIEGHNAGQPLSFLDHHVKCGDSLVGVFDLKSLEQGIPDDAYKAVETDDKPAAREYRKRNKQERESRQMRLAASEPLKEVAGELEALSHLDERTPDDVERKEKRYSELRVRRELLHRKNACDAWTAAFFVPLTLPPLSGQDLVPTTASVWSLREGGQVYGKQIQVITRAAIERSFFHWPLEFPDVSSHGGFDVIIGNPPWGQKEVSADDKLRNFITTAFPSVSGIFDSFRPFVELVLRLQNPNGRMGLVLPDILLLKDYESTRELLLGGQIYNIDWWGMVFPGATIDAITIVASAQSRKERHPILINVRDEENPLRHSILQSEFERNARKTFNLFLTEEKRRALNLIDASSKRLADYFEIHEGVHSGNIRSKLFLQQQVDDTCRRLIVSGAGVEPFFVPWQGDYIRLAAVPKSRTPKEYANVGKTEWYQSNKLVVRRTGDRVIAAIDERGTFFSNNFFVLVPKNDSGPSLFAVCAILNSPFTTWYFRTIEPREGRAFAEIKIKHLEVLPLPVSLLSGPAAESLAAMAKERYDLALAQYEASSSPTRPEAARVLDDAMNDLILGALPEEIREVAQIREMSKADELPKRRAS